MGFYIESYHFDKQLLRCSDGEELSSSVMGTNWPVVYLIHGNGELYIGETSDACGRMNQHLDTNGKHYKQRQKLNTVEIVFDVTYNKSAILDIEQSLIRLFKYEIYSLDKHKKSEVFKSLQNGNSGQSRQHNYYQRPRYQQEVSKIWAELVNRNLAKNRYDDIVNDNIYKYSPYSTLTSEQSNVCLSILEDCMNALENNKENTAIVQGGAGTGKTIVLLHMMSIVANAAYSNEWPIDGDDDFDEEDYAITLSTLNRINKLSSRINSYVKKIGHPLRIAYVAQMTALRSTIGATLRNLPHFHKKDALGPNDIVNNALSSDGRVKQYDILFIDEAHRLWRREKIQNMGAFDKACRMLYGPNVSVKETTTLDWLMSCSKTRIIVYDDAQTVKESDLTKQQYASALASAEKRGQVRTFKLKQQMRCEGGIEYISYLDLLFGESTVPEKKVIENYNLGYFDDPVTLINTIAERNEQCNGLCRVVTGYGWQWKKQRYDECHNEYKKAVNSGRINDTRQLRRRFYLDYLTEDDGLILLNDELFVRNLDYDWVIDGDPREIGCIHTSQGYDLNYVGVLFGPEIDYIEGKGIVIYEDKIQDISSVSTAMSGLSLSAQEQKSMHIKQYVINAYKVMMSRGIKGCYVWAYNSGMKNFLSKLI